jgi:hypothetical protein
LQERFHLPNPAIAGIGKIEGFIRAERGHVKIVESGLRGRAAIAARRIRAGAGDSRADYAQDRSIRVNAPDSILLRIRNVKTTILADRDPSGSPELGL